MQRLEQLESRPGADDFAPSCIFAGGEVGFKAGVGVGKAAPNGHCQLSRADLLPTQPTEPQSVTAETLPRDGHCCGGGACVAIERAERIKIGRASCRERV